MTLFFIVFLNVFSSQAKVEALAGGGIMDEKGAGVFEIGFDVVDKSLSLGISLPFAVDHEGGFYKSMWDEGSDFGSAIRYLSWYRKSEEINAAVRIGNENDITIGTGALVKNLTLTSELFRNHSALRLYFENPHLRLNGFINDFVEPRFGGGDLTVLFTEYLSAGTSFFLDTQAVLHLSDPMGITQVDTKLRKIIPWETGNLIGSSVFLTFKPATWFSTTIQAVSFDPSDIKGWGGVFSADFKYAGKKWKLDFKLRAAAGGSGFTYAPVDQFYLVRNFYFNMDSGNSLLSGLKNKTMTSAGGSADFTASYGNKMTVSGGIRTASGNHVFHLSSLIFVKKGFQLSFYGAFSDEENFIFALESRLKVSRSFFVFLRGARQYTVTSLQPVFQSSTMAFAGIGGNYRLE